MVDAARRPFHGHGDRCECLGWHAEEWISEVSLLIRARIPVQVAIDVVHPFPTFGEILEGPLWELAARLDNQV